LRVLNDAFRNRFIKVQFTKLKLEGVYWLSNWITPRMRSCMFCSWYWILVWRLPQSLWSKKLLIMTRSIFLQTCLAMASEVMW